MTREDRTGHLNRGAKTGKQKGGCKSANIENSGQTRGLGKGQTRRGGEKKRHRQDI